MQKLEIMEHRFTEVFRDPSSGGAIMLHSLVDTDAADYNDVYEISVDMANRGCFVEILPELVINHPLYPVIFKGAKENKCPDLRIDGKYFEVKTPTLPLKREKLSTCIKNSKEQANFVIIRLLAKYLENGLLDVANGRFETHESLERVEFKCCLTNNYYCYDRPNGLK